MNKYFLFVGFIFLVAVSVVSAQSPGCGPTPNIPNQPIASPMVNPSQAAQNAKQIQIIQARADYQASIARIQTQQQVSNIQNQGNPQMQQQTAQQFQQQIQQLQQNFNQTMQNLQRQ